MIRFPAKSVPCKLQGRIKYIERYRFVDGLPWKAGQFGDNGSCFWGCRNIARELLSDAGTKAIQFFYRTDSGKFRGCGRALVLPLREPANTYVLFNAYGVHLSAVGELLGREWNTPYAEVQMVNGESADYVIYANGGIGLLFSENNKLRLVNVGKQCKVDPNFTITLNGSVAHIDLQPPVPPHYFMYKGKQLKRIDMGIPTDGIKEVVCKKCDMGYYARVKHPSGIARSRIYCPYCEKVLSYRSPYKYA